MRGRILVAPHVHHNAVLRHRTSCRFFLNGASLNEEAEDEAFDGFLSNMNKLFETFITTKLGARLQSPFRLDDQVRTQLDDAGSVAIRPDLVLSHRGRTVLIGDTKYKKLDDDEHKHADLYQMLAYCTALGVDAGVLVYPRHITDVDTRLAIRNSPIRLREASVDLRGSIDQVEAGLNALAVQLRLWSDRTPVPA